MARNNIFSMVIENTVVEQEEMITDHIWHYYKNLYIAGESLGNDLIDEVIPSLAAEQNSSLVVIPPEK